MQRPAAGPVKGSQAPDWVERPERSNALALRAIVWVATAIGRPAARLLLHPICVYFLAFAPSARSASRRDLGRVLGRGAGIADLSRHFHAFASVLLDRVFLLNDQLSRFDVRVHGAEAVDDLLAKGTGCIILGAHLGSLEVGRARGRLRGLAIRMLMYEENARKVGAMLRAVNPRLDADVIALGRLDAMLKVEAALERGEAVGMLADRTFGDAGTASLPFLGAPARFPTGPIRVARILDRPTLLLFGLYRGGNRYDIHIERFAEPGEQCSKEELLRRYVARLEHYCRLAPYNWFNFYDFWR